MHVDCKENWLWNLGNERFEGETRIPGKISQSPGKVLEMFWKSSGNLFLWKRTNPVIVISFCWVCDKLWPDYLPSSINCHLIRSCCGALDCIWEVKCSSPRLDNNHGLKRTEDIILPYWFLMTTLSSLTGIRLKVRSVLEANGPSSWSLSLVSR